MRIITADGVELGLHTANTIGQRSLGGGTTVILEVQTDTDFIAVKLERQEAETLATAIRATADCIPWD